MNLLLDCSKPWGGYYRIVLGKQLADCKALPWRAVAFGLVAACRHPGMPGWWLPAGIQACLAGGCLQTSRHAWLVAAYRHPGMPGWCPGWLAALVQVLALVLALVVAPGPGPGPGPGPADIAGWLP